MREKLVGLWEAKPSKELSSDAYYCDIFACFLEILDAAKCWMSTRSKKPAECRILFVSVLQLDD